MNPQSASASAAAAKNLILLREDLRGVAILTLNHPRTRNALSEAMLEALSDAFTAIAHDKSVRTVVLAAEGYELERTCRAPGSGGEWSERPLCRSMP